MRHADLFIAHAYCRDKTMGRHMDLATLAARLPEIAPKRAILTHMSPEVLDRRAAIPHAPAEDGKTIDL